MSGWMFIRLPWATLCLTFAHLDIAWACDAQSCEDLPDVNLLQVSQQLIASETQHVEKRRVFAKQANEAASLNRMQRLALKRLTYSDQSQHRQDGAPSGLEDVQPWYVPKFHRTINANSSRVHGRNHSGGSHRNSSTVNGTNRSAKHEKHHVEHADHDENMDNMEVESGGLDMSAYKSQPGLATLYSTPDDDMDLIVDITDLLMNESSASEIMVTVLAAKGTYSDMYGQIVSLHEALEESQAQIFKLVLSPDNKTVDVLAPHMSLRTSDEDSQTAWSQGSDSTWISTLKRLRTSLGDDAIVVDGMQLISMGFFIAPMLGSDIGGSGAYQLTKVKSFENNFDISLTYVGERGQISLTFSVIRPPKQPMLPRVFDDRLAFFTQDYIDMGVHQPDTGGAYIDPRKTVDPRVSVIWRYDLSRLANNQIKIHVDPSVPKRWHNAFKEGIEAWNDAFVEAGWSGYSIRGVLPSDKDWPDDYDAGDARFSTISWAVDTDSVVSVGIAKVDPRSGEILKSDIIMGSGWVRAWLSDYHTYSLSEKQDLSAGFFKEKLTVAQVDEHRESSMASNDDEASMLQADATIKKKANAENRMKTESEAEHGALHFDNCPLSLLAMGMTKGSWVSVANAALKSVVMHETGHVLGLRHNFKGSAGVSYECTQDKSCSAKEGLTASIMDYLPMNIPSAGIDNVHLFTPVVGKFDKLAIRYGYMKLPSDAKEVRDGLPVAPQELKEVLDQANDLQNCIDEDRMLDQDPLCTTYDFTAEPLRYFEDQAKLIRKVQDKLLELSVAPGEPYLQYGEKIGRVMTKVFGMQDMMMGWVGGMNFSRVHRPLKEGATKRPSIRSISAKDQRKAVRLILEMSRPVTSGLVPSGDKLANLPYERQNSISTMNIRENIRSQQESVMGGLLNTQRLRHIELSMDYGGMPINTFFDDVIFLVLGSKDGEGLVKSVPEDWDLQRFLVQQLVSERQDVELAESVRQYLLLASQSALQVVENGLKLIGRDAEWEDCSSPGTKLCTCSGKVRLLAQGRQYTKEDATDDGVVECKADTFKLVDVSLPTDAKCQCLRGTDAKEPLRMHFLQLKGMLKKYIKDAGADESKSYTLTSAWWLLQVLIMSQLAWVFQC